MTPTLDPRDPHYSPAEFHRRYPHLFVDRIGLECGDGWNLLLDEMAAALEALIVERLNRGGWPAAASADADDANTANAVGWPRAVQIKEKFGSLRVYMIGSSPELQAVIDVARKKANITCDKCGGPGTMREGGWWRVRCDRHVDARWNDV